MLNEGGLDLVAVGRLDLGRGDMAITLSVYLFYSRFLSCYLLVWMFGAIVGYVSVQKSILK